MVLGGRRSTVRGVLGRRVGAGSTHCRRVEEIVAWRWWHRDGSAIDASRSCWKGGFAEGGWGRRVGRADRVVRAGAVETAA